MRYKNIILVVIVFVSSYVGAEEENLCKGDEVMVATCTLREKKSRHLSFCSSANKKVMHYRFGLKEKIEMDVVFSSGNPVSRWLDVWVYTTYFGFRSRDYAYVLGVPEEKFGARAFLVVSKKEKPIMDRTCVTNSFGEKTLLNEAIEEVDDDVVRDNKFLFPPQKNRVID